MYRFVTRSIRALGEMLADTLVRLGNEPSIGWLSDDAFGWDWRYLCSDDAPVVANAVSADCGDVAMGSADRRPAQAALSHTGVTAQAGSPRP